MAAKSSAALADERDLLAAAQLALSLEGFWNPEVRFVERVRPGLIRVGFLVQREDGGRAARLAAIRTDNGTPAVRVVRGWPLDVP